MSSNSSFQIATWYDTWNQQGLDNLTNKIVPLNYATRYNLAFGELVQIQSGGYSINMTGKYAAQVKQQLVSQAPGITVYAGLGDTGITDAVNDNNANNNRSTANIVSWLQQNGYQGISIDAESSGMTSVPEFVTQLGPSFKQAGLGIAVSVPWPGNGPSNLYGTNAVTAFNANVDYLELQDYSSYGGTPVNAPVWTKAGINPQLLMGGVCTEPGNYTTSISDTQTWTQSAISQGLGGMFSWRLDNDHSSGGEDNNPTFAGAKTVYDTVNS